MTDTVRIRRLATGVAELKRVPAMVMMRGSTKLGGIRAIPLVAHGLLGLVIGA